ncbi:MAG: hypothetical protein AAFZ09_15455, partial [Pseudomonadota bacterium]
ESLGAPLAAHPPARAPPGWGALRHLGLAMGFRISDTESADGDHLRGGALMGQVQAGMDRAGQRYRMRDEAMVASANGPQTPPAAETAGLGQPFAEFLVREDDLFALSSFDGRDSVERGTRKRILESAAATLAQIALRPVPGAWESPATAGANEGTAPWLPVRYLVRTLPEGLDGGETLPPADARDTLLDITLPPDLGDRFLVDAALVSPERPGWPTERLLETDLARCLGLDPTPEIEPETAERWIRYTRGDLPRTVETGHPVAVLRLCYFGDDPEADWPRIRAHLSSEIVGAQVEAAFVDQPGIDADMPGFDPFERFAPLDGEIRAMLGVRSSVGADRWRRALVDNLLMHAPPAIATGAVPGLQREGAVKIQKPDAEEMAELASFAQKLGAWSETFLTHGADSRPAARDG